MAGFLNSFTRPQRAIAGAIAALLVLAVGYGGARVATGALVDHYTVSVVLGQTGQGVIQGSDVKIRGVRVGEIGRLTLTDDLQAVAELVLDGKQEIPERATFAVTGKTLLGEKQIEIVFDGPVEDGPFLASGSTVADDTRVVEFQDVLAQLNKVFTAINPDDLATVIDEGVGAFDGQGPQIAAAIDQGSRAANVGVRVLDDQVASTRDLSLLIEAIAPTGAEFNRMATEFNAGLPTLADNQARARVLLADLERFSGVLNATFTIDRASIDRMIVQGDSVTRMLFAYSEEVGELMSGLVSYTEKFDAGLQVPGGFTGQAARFQIIADDTFVQSLCTELPDQLTSQLPPCGGTESPPPSAAAAPPTTVAPAPEPPGIELPLPPELTRPEVPGRLGVDSVLYNALEGVLTDVAPEAGS
jgi:phospholipid/cholesterol/gamma-HCH transport system substrate-binding protein